MRAAFRRLRDLAATPGRRRPGGASLVDATVWKARSFADDGVSEMPVEPSAGDSMPRDLAPIFGEFAWHSLTADSRLLQISEDHYRLVAELLNGAGGRAARGARVLEVAAYAHITGYMLHERLGARTDLLDISPSTLRLGRRIAREQGLATDGTTCVAGDFHELPYEDDQFDVVYICSALHHTWHWERVVSEMLRVLAPAGILFLENEPCRRLFCHYRFRANRPERFGDLEQALDRLGILRTVAEPFPSTRPETLFGMVENQTIPVTALCAALAAKCSPIAITVDTEVCMGSLERELVARIRDDPGACPDWLAEELVTRVEQASRAMTAADAGMGFSLPTPQEIAKLCESTCAALAGLPEDQSSPDFRLGIAEVFGASVQMTLRKKGRRRLPPTGRLRQHHPSLEEVVCAFPPRVARLLDPRNVLLPDIQSSPLSTLKEVFPESDWRFGVTPDALRDLSPAIPRPSFTIRVPHPGPLLVIVRLYVAFEQQPFRIALCDNSGELAGYNAYRADSLLLSAVVRCGSDASVLRMSIRTRGLDETVDAPVGFFTLSYAGAFPL